MARIKVYTTTYCGYCRAAKSLLDRKKIAYEEVDVTSDDAVRDWLVEKTGRTTVPQIFIDDEPIGGYTDLAALDSKGELDKYV